MTVLKKKKNQPNLQQKGFDWTSEKDMSNKLGESVTLRGEIVNCVDTV